MLDVFENKEARGYILKVAKLSYPKPISSHVIEACLIDAGMHMSSTQVEGQIQYLEERGYIKTQKSKLEITGTVVSLVTLTANGIDLLERTITDDGVPIK